MAETTDVMEASEFKHLKSKAEQQIVKAHALNRKLYQFQLDKFLGLLDAK
jgi:hypothetical protein